MPAGVAKALLPEGDSGTSKKTQGKPVQNHTTGPNTDAQLTQPEATTPGEIGKPTNASRPADTLQRVLLTEGDTPMDSGANPGITPDTARGNPDMVPAKPETAPQIQPEMEKPDIAQDVPKTRTDAPRLKTDLRTEADVNTDADSAVTPVSYEDALRDYLGKGTEPSAVLKTNADTEHSIPQEAAPKTKEQIISELAPKIWKPGITPGRAVIEAQRMHTDAERIFGSNAEVVLEMFEYGQEPRKFLGGIQNAYLAGKLGEKAALENSSAAAYLTEDQSRLAYTLGNLASNVSVRESLDIVHNSSTMESDDLWIGKSLGAKAKNYEVELPDGEKVYLTEGTRISNIETIAGKGRNRQIDEIDILLERYGGSEFEWMKKKGRGYIDYQGESYFVELHWYEEPSVGKHKWKEKADKDGNWFVYED